MGSTLITSCPQTAWGTRDGADDDDAYRMIRVGRKHLEAGFTASETSAQDLSTTEKGTNLARDYVHGCVAMSGE